MDALWSIAVTAARCYHNNRVSQRRSQKLGHSWPSSSLLNHIVSEFAQLARTEGVELDVEETIAYLKALALKVGSHYPSMHQDLANRRLTEIDFLNGTVARESEAKGLEAPYCQMITQLIHAKEDVLGISK